MKPNQRNHATAFAPATVANVAVGFDILGFALEAVGDRVTVSRIPEPGKVEIGEISGGIPLPTDPTKNTATAGLLQLCRDLNLKFGFHVSIQKGIPLGSGMGGSAASAVGALVAANALLETPLSREQLFKYTLEGERVASGAVHGDNVAPCLFGGLTLTLSLQPPEVIPLPCPSDLLCVLVHPNFRLDTRVARGVLKPEVLLKEHVRQSGYLAGFLAACFRGDLALLRRSMIDILIEPQRSALIPGFDPVKQAALAKGALGCSISGSGPSVFAFASSRPAAEQIRAAMIAAFNDAGLGPVDAWISPISSRGATLV